jgi:hypothetical protein
VRALRDAGLLDRGAMRTGDLYDATGLDALLDRADQPDFRDWPLVGRILTLELSLQAVDGASVST